MTNDDQPELNLKQKLNLETGKLSWPELQTYFARGVVIIVTPACDLIEVAVQLSEDNAQLIEQMINKGEIIRANDEHAIHWLETSPSFWSVVISPWVLVQEITEPGTELNL